MKRQALELTSQIFDRQLDILKDTTADLRTELSEELKLKSDGLQYTTHDLEYQRRHNAGIIDDLYSFLPSPFVLQKMHGKNSLFFEYVINTPGFKSMSEVSLAAVSNMAYWINNGKNGGDTFSKFDVNYDVWHPIGSRLSNERFVTDVLLRKIGTKHNSNYFYSGIHHPYIESYGNFKIIKVANPIGKLIMSNATTLPSGLPQPKSGELNYDQSAGMYVFDPLSHDVLTVRRSLSRGDRLLFDNHFPPRSIQKYFTWPVRDLSNSKNRDLRTAKGPTDEELDSFGVLDTVGLVAIKFGDTAVELLKKNLDKYSQ